MNRRVFHNCTMVLFAAIMAHVLLNPCGAAAADSNEPIFSGSSQDLSGGTLAILPFIKGDLTENFRTGIISPLICPVDQVCVDLTDGDETGLFMEKLDKDLHRIVKMKLGANVIAQAETKAQYDAIPIDPSKDTTLSRALGIARKLRTDYVLIPILWDYTERVGTDFSVEKPASVSIGLYLVSAEQEKRVWKESYDRTQQSLTDNLFNAKEFFKLGGHWVTAQELAQAGMQKILQDFPLSPQ